MGCILLTDTIACFNGVKSHSVEKVANVVSQVHELHVALQRKGFWSGDDDMQWWQYGDSTISAVQTAQVRPLHVHERASLVSSLSTV